MSRHWLAACCFALAGASAALTAAPVATATAMVAGTRNVTTADPAIPRPGTTPCVVQLFGSEAFGTHGDSANMSATPHRFDYRPPARCRAPWAKVVLVADFAVDRGYQYDRTASIWLDGVNLYFGTTQEPTPRVAPHWQIQRDLTAYSSLLRQPGHGSMLINNWLSGLRSSVIHASAKLLFYPADARFPAPRVPDAVMALNRVGALPAQLATGDDTLARDVVFPRNTTRVYLDEIAQPQSHDEDYYACSAAQVKVCSVRPGDKAATGQGAATPFREVLVSIDGRAAGLAPVAPYVYTGGLDPYLWEPTPANQTLNFMPYRIDLTPFAGELADGKPHRVALKVLNADHYFAVAGTLLVYTDGKTSHTGGSVTRNTLEGALPKPVVGQVPGNADTLSTRAETHYVIEGYVDTPAGRVTTRVTARIGFDNLQQFVTYPTRDVRHVVQQAAGADTTSHTSGAGVPEQSRRQRVRYRLDVNEVKHPTAAKSLSDSSVQVAQAFSSRLVAATAGEPVYTASVHNLHRGSDHWTFDDTNRASLLPHGQVSVQRFTFDDSLGDCYGTEVRAADNRVTDVATGLGCLGGQSTLHWFVHPDGSPDDLGWRRDGAW